MNFSFASFASFAVKSFFRTKAVQWFMPITYKVNESAPGRHRFIGVHRRLSAAQPFLA
jgi:hypothetical protein